MTNRHCQVGIFEIQLGAPIAAPDDELHCVEILHLEVRGVYKLVQWFQVDYWPMATRFFRDGEDATKETVIFDYGDSSFPYKTIDFTRAEL